MPPPPPPEPAPPPPVAVAAPMAPEAAAAPAAAPKLTWGGWLDTYYLFNFLRPDGTNTLLPPVGRAFDTNSNSVTMSMAAATLTASMDPVAFQLDFGYGSMGTIINYAGLGGALTPPLPAAPVVTAPVGGSFVLLQAYGSITVLGKLTLDFGKFYTTAGAEVIPTNKNWLYSRSMLFNIIPLLHTGARANFKVNDMLSLQASVLNGWNDDPDLNAWKDVGLSAAITPNSMLTIAITEYLGKPLPQGAMASTPGDLRSLTDLVVGLTLSDKLGLNLNVDYINGFNGNSSDYQVGVAGMGRFVINEHVNIAARGEWVRTHTSAVMANGSNNQDLMEGTLMLGLPVGKNFELRPEFRFDHGGQSALFFNGKNDQVTGTLAALAYF